jgi:hypothetical protein
MKSVLILIGVLFFNAEMYGQYYFISAYSMDSVYNQDDIDKYKIRRIVYTLSDTGKKYGDAMQLAFSYREFDKKGKLINIHQQAVCGEDYSRSIKYNSKEEIEETVVIVKENPEDTLAVQLERIAVKNYWDRKLVTRIVINSKNNEVVYALVGNYWYDTLVRELGYWQHSNSNPDVYEDSLNIRYNEGKDKEIKEFTNGRLIRRTVYKDFGLVNYHYNLEDELISIDTSFYKKQTEKEYPSVNVNPLNIEYEYYPGGMKKCEEWFSPDSLKPSGWWRKYDSAGKEILFCSYGFNFKKNLILTQESIYDSLGRIAKQIYYFHDSMVVTNLYKYNTKGFLIEEMNNFNSYKIKTFSNEKGLITRREYKNTYGTEIEEYWEYEYYE